MAVLTKLNILLDILALVSIPLLILILAYNRFVPRIRILNEDVNTKLSTNYIIISGFGISVASVIVSLAPFFY
jgi:uncharacterized membrane protein YidH (DUF202 family)